MGSCWKEEWLLALPPGASCISTWLDLLVFSSSTIAFEVGEKMSVSWPEAWKGCSSHDAESLIRPKVRDVCLVCLSLHVLLGERVAHQFAEYAGS